uniref:Seizure related 6 homolog like n=1 Tax=Callorhinchus milii TaxID=7868 RepID=A0A4W3IWL0_CALMI
MVVCAFSSDVGVGGELGTTPASHLPARAWATETRGGETSEMGLEAVNDHDSPGVNLFDSLVQQKKGLLSRRAPGPPSSIPVPPEKSWIEPVSATSSPTTSVGPLRPTPAPAKPPSPSSNSDSKPSPEGSLAVPDGPGVQENLVVKATEAHTMKAAARRNWDGPTQHPPVRIGSSGTVMPGEVSARPRAGENANPMGGATPGPPTAWLTPASPTGRAETPTEEKMEATTTTIVTTTTITTLQTAAPCGVSFSDPEGYIDSADFLPMSSFGPLECTFNVTVYTGYGVELQIKSLNLSEGELLCIRGLEEENWVLLANQTLLVEGQVIRSPTNTISTHFHSLQYGGIGSFQLHYQPFMLSCSFPRRPDFGDVSVMDLHAEGSAHFRCNPGYHLQGLKTLTCMNASRPHWSAKEPTCEALCGGVVRNASIGRILSPNYPANYSSNLTCTWTIEGMRGQKLHLHFEKVALAGKEDRLIVRNGEQGTSLNMYDSSENPVFPLEGVISEGPKVHIKFISDEERTGGGFNIRYEAFEHGHCYEPYMQNGNFTSTDHSYSVGSVVEFTCDPGYTLEQGSAIIECIDIRESYWNETEPLCRALCGGELTSQAGVILSPNWPEPYDEGKDCIWKIHVGEEKRIFLDVQLINLSNSDILTLYDGDDLTMRILGQYVGSNIPLKVYSSTSDLTIRFHSDPAGLVFGKGQGFIMNYYEVSRNDTCSDLPEIPNGWKTTSHREMVRGTTITYQCDPGYDIVGSDTLTCQWDLLWSSEAPFCEKIMYCTDAGEVEHSTRSISDTKLLVGSTIQYSCDPDHILDGSALLTCYSRETGTPLWTSRLPRCVTEESVACENPGLPENGYQILYKRLYLPGETLTFMCYEGFELMGELTIKCLMGHPSHWSGALPQCKAPQYGFQHTLEVAEAAAESALEGGNMALAIFIPILIISILLGGAYIYITRCRYHSNLRLPLMSSHPYSQITVETAFDNPIYETGDTREYEVSI